MIEFRLKYFKLNQNLNKERNMRKVLNLLLFISGFLFINSCDNLTKPDYRNTFFKGKPQLELGTEYQYLNIKLSYKEGITEELIFNGENVEVEVGLAVNQNNKANDPIIQWYQSAYNGIVNDNGILVISLGSHISFNYAKLTFANHRTRPFKIKSNTNGIYETALQIDEGGNGSGGSTIIKTKVPGTSTGSEEPPGE
jgi:hypothetical protein